MAVRRDHKVYSQASPKSFAFDFTAFQTLMAVLASNPVMDYRKFITVEPGKRGGKPCVRGLRITVSDVLGWIAAGMSWTEILDDYPDLTEQDIRACLAYAADQAT